MAGSDSSSTQSNNRSYVSRDGRGSTFDRNMQSYLKTKGQVRYDEVIPDELKNTKYKYFRNTGMGRAEAVSRNSVALNNDWNNTPFSAIEQDKSFSDLMYSQASEDKPGRLRDYRTISCFSEVADALDEICDEFITVDDNHNVMNIRFKLSDMDSIQKEEITNEFQKFVNYLELEDNGWGLFRQFLIEGELFFELIVKEDYLNQGVLAIRNLPADLFDPVYDNIQTMLVKAFIYKKPIFSAIDPRKVERFEFIPFEQSQVLYINSGQYNETKDYVIPFLENCRRPYRQLTMMEDSIVIHRMVHAPLRFIFNVDVGKLPVPQAEQYLKKLQAQYWSTKTFDIDQHDIAKKYSPQSTMDSFWFAKRQGQEPTTVESFGGQPDSGGMEILDWFIKKLYRSLKVPTSRLNSETGFSDGQEILREELKFANMIIRQQRKFAAGIKKAFITHLKLRKMYDEYDMCDDDFELKFNVPTNFYDMRENQRMELKMATFTNVASQELISASWAMKKYLDYSDRDILANRELKRKDAELQWELAQIQQFGPGWKQMVAQQAEQAEADIAGGGDIGGGGDSGLPDIPAFGGGAAALGGDTTPPPTNEEPVETTGAQEEV